MGEGRGVGEGGGLAVGWGVGNTGVVGDEAGRLAGASSVAGGTASGVRLAHAPRNKSGKKRVAKERRGWL